MTTLTRPEADEHPSLHRPAGWILMAIGVTTAAWWVSAWSKVHSLITDHVSAHGQLPTDFGERAALYANGTPAEQALANSLDQISGLYPWGRLPLALGLLAFVVGAMIAGPATRRRIAVTVAVASVMVLVPLIVFGDSMRIALDILE